MLLLDVEVDVDSRAVPLAAEQDAPCAAADRVAPSPAVPRGLFAWYVLRSEEFSTLAAEARADTECETECACACAGDSLTRFAE